MRYLLSVGSNAENQLGHSLDADAHAFQPALASSASASSSRTFPPPEHDVLSLALGANHSLALLSGPGGATEVWGTGDGSKGQLGLVSPSPSQGFRPLDLPPWPASLPRETVQAMRPTHIATSFSSSFIAFSPASSLSSSSSSSSSPAPPTSLLLAMGSNDFGELANGTRSATSTFAWHVFEEEEIELVEAGPRHVVLVVRSDGKDFQEGKQRKQRVLGWGVGRHGQLGDLSTEAARDPAEKRKKTSSASPVVRPTRIDLPPSSRVGQISLGFNHSLFLPFPSPSPSPPSPASSFDSFSHPLSLPPAPFSLPPSHIPTPSLLHDLNSISRLASSWHTSYFLTSSSSSGERTRIVAKGRNDRGQLGVGSSTSPSSDVKASHEGEVLFPEEILPLEIAAGSEHVLCLVSTRSSHLFSTSSSSSSSSSSAAVGSSNGSEEDPAVYGWGWNEHGNLSASLLDHPLPVRIWPPPPPLATQPEGVTANDSGDRARGTEGEKWRSGKARKIWAGYGTSWILVETEEP